MTDAGAAQQEGEGKEGETIRIGTLAGKGARTPEYIRALLPHGFESFQINFYPDLGGVDLAALAPAVETVLAAPENTAGAPVSALGIYGNPLAGDGPGEDSREAWRQCIDHARAFGTDIVAGFTGRLRDHPVPDCIPRFREVFGELGRRAADRGVRIAFENCPMGGDWERGDWNLAFNPDAWELLFDALPDLPLGLEWEPCHQLCQLIDPLPQLRAWAPRIFHLHGKDANVHRDRIAASGVLAPGRWAEHRHPGFGDTDWTAVVSELRAAGFAGSIDIEGWHDPVYRDALELTGQVHALQYLKRCRTNFVPNPPGF